MGAVTTLVDRLEKNGYLKRVRVAEDRRKVLVQLTAKAKRRLGEIYGPIGEHAYETLREYSDKELKLFRDFIEHSRNFLAQHNEHMLSLMEQSVPQIRSARAEARTDEGYLRAGGAATAHSRTDSDHRLVRSTT